MKTDIKHLWDTVRYGMKWVSECRYLDIRNLMIKAITYVIADCIKNDTKKERLEGECIHLTKCKTFEEFEVEYNKMICPKIPWENEPQFCPYCGNNTYIRYVNSIICKDEEPSFFYGEIDEYQCMSDKCDGHSFFV